MECISEELSEVQIAYHKAKEIQFSNLNQLCQDIIDQASLMKNQAQNVLPSLPFPLPPSINQVFSVDVGSPLALPEASQIPMMTSSSSLPAVPIESENLLLQMEQVHSLKQNSASLLCNESLPEKSPVEISQTDDANPDSPTMILSESESDQVVARPVKPVSRPKKKANHCHALSLKSTKVSSARGAPVNYTEEMDPDSPTPLPKKSKTPTPQIQVIPTPVKPDHAEIPINKLVGGETLVTCLNSLKRSKDNAETRKNLDLSVKNILMKNSQDFVLHLFEEGFISTRCFCSLHQSAKSECKLIIIPSAESGRYGGYVWQSKCCYKLYSVYKNSIFDLPQTYNISGPSMIKLIYHWCCQTPLPNVETWLKMSKETICKVYQLFRSACSIILQDSKNVLGSYTQIIEIAIMAYPETDIEDEKAQFLGLYDKNKDSYRMFCCRPEKETEVERLAEIMLPAHHIVYPHATLVADATISKSLLSQVVRRRFNLSTIEPSSKVAKPTNKHILKFMSEKLKMFSKACLSELSVQEIQSSLDEVCWRDKYGKESSEICYKNFTEHLVGLTSMEVKNEGVIPLLTHVTEHGAHDWRYNRSLMDPMPRYPMPVGIKNKFCDMFKLDESNQLKDCNPVQHSNKARSIHTTHGSSAAIAIQNIQRPAKPPLIETVSQIDGPLVALEEYFYGRLSGIQTNGCEGAHTHLQCHICDEKFGYNNVKFFLHLKRHLAKSFNSDIENPFACSYCVKTFSSEKEVTKHVVSNHYMFDTSELWCRICSLRYKKSDSSNLKEHMMSKHVEKEIPYRCQVCQFGTSMYIEIIDHFNRNHQNSSYIMCHMCLLTFQIPYSKGKEISEELYEHLMKHNPKLKVDCTKCCLSFTDDEHLSVHQKEHNTCQSAIRLTKYHSQRGYKDIFIKPQATTPSDDKDCMAARKLITMSRVKQKDSLIICVSERDLECIECDTRLLGFDHFKTRLECAECPFTTNCSRSMVKHYTHNHIRKHGVKRKRKPLPSIGNGVWCGCGYTCKDGNRFATHGMNCKKIIKCTKKLPKMLTLKQKLDSDEEEL